METYTNAIKKELSQIKVFDVIKNIKEMDLNNTVLPHLELGEDLVNDIRTAWLNGKLFNVDCEEHYCTKNYVREVILRYCQNRIELKKKYNVSDGMKS